MTTQEDLGVLLERWRDLTEQEGEAIRAGAWSNVAAFQSCKQSLQATITGAAALSAQNTSPWVRESVAQLIVLERKNVDLIADQRRFAELERAEMDRSSRNLRQVRQSYARTEASHWQSYS